MIVSLVVAVAENGVIGRDGGLPWRLSSDLKTFRRLTMGKPLIMGRRTFQSLGKPLDGRDNIVVSRDPDFQPEGAIVEPSFETALNRARLLARARGTDEIMVIGGTQVFTDALGHARFIYKTEVQGAPAGDAHFPAIDWDAWKEVSREALARAPQDDFAAELVVLERK
jgi:dihydrofolate reductase